MATLFSKSPQFLATSVCIVDDMDDYRILVEATFKRYLSTYSLLSFANGQALLDALPQMSRQPNLVLLDQHMPQLSGYETLLALKQHSEHRSIPVVMMSADASPSEISHFYAAGATGFLPKPLDSMALKEALLTACQYASKPH